MKNMIANEAVTILVVFLAMLILAIGYMLGYDTASIPSARPVFHSHARAQR